MKFADYLAEAFADSQLGRDLQRSIRALFDQNKRKIDQSRVDRRRKLILEALKLEGLTASDGEKLLSWAEPGTVTGDEALALLKVLRAAAGNIKKGKGLLKDEEAQRNILVELCFWMTRTSILHDTSTTPVRRLQEIKKTRWWPEIVEAMYRAELLSAQQGANDLLHHTPSQAAEAVVARVINASGSGVHLICHQVRQQQKLGDSSPLEPISVQRFERWLSDGGGLLDSQS